jgi:aconitate hydratase 2/2-methylisocitrate dehydratase
MFDNFYDVEEKAKAGNVYAKQVMQSWADAEWFLNRPALAEKITVTVFKVTGETNTDDLSGTGCLVSPGYPAARAGDAEKRP